MSAVPRKGIAGIRAFQMGSQTLQPQPPAAQAEQPSGAPASADTLSDNLSRMLSLSTPPSPPLPEATSADDSGNTCGTLHYIVFTITTSHLFFYHFDMD